MTTAPSSTHSSTGYDLTPPTAAQMNQLVTDLSVEERHVLLNHGTEAPFCGTLLDNKLGGTYCCRICALPLFNSVTKFDSGTGWPSFAAPYDPQHIRYLEDSSGGRLRTEIRCARCDSHQGHVFPDGPPPTNQRYCLNSVSLTFVTKGDTMPDSLGRHESKTA